MTIGTAEFKTVADTLTAKQILAIPGTEPERLFEKPDKDEIKDLYRELAKKWHTDVNKSPEAEDVFKRVAELYNKANEKLKNGTWQKPDELLINTTDNKTYKIKYLRKHEFELGEFYISDTMVTFFIRKEFSDLFDNGINNIKNLRFANEDMRKNNEALLPKVHKILETKDHKILTIQKTPDVVLLDDLLRHEGGKLDPKHVAWMTTRFHNLTAYLQWSGTVHNNIDLKTCFVSPEFHSVLLLGGWWYARPAGKDLIGLPNYTLNSVPRTVLETGLADRRTDHALIRSVSRQLLGDQTGVRLSRDREIPKPMVDWLCLPGSGDAYEDYKTWLGKVVTDSFGKRSFHPFNVKPHDIYKPI